MPLSIESRQPAPDRLDHEFGLSPRAIGALRGLFAAYPQIGQAKIYGSRARGNYREGSDIDIALDAPEMTVDTFFKLCGQIDDLMLPWEVDLTLMRLIDNLALLDHIERVGKVLWSKPITNT